MGSLLDQIKGRMSRPKKGSSRGGSRSKKRVPFGASKTYTSAVAARRTGKPARPSRVTGSKSLTRS
tara:strand:- start:260 stop:457 length:198 start_codon:yes stop_codon:yes gene_type:complete